MAELILERTKRKALFYKEILVTEPQEIALEMTKIPAGGFWMGTPEEEIERLCKEYKVNFFRRESPQHWVNIPKFFLGKYPITQGQWRIVAAWEQEDRELKLEPSNFKGDDRLPVEQVSWLDAKEFCARLSKKSKRKYRLPTESEWEYACRAITPFFYMKGVRDKQVSETAQFFPQDLWNQQYHQPFHFGETLSDQAANYVANNVYGRGVKGEEKGKTTPVGSFPANDFGLWDMHGNVFEWCEDDWQDHYKNAPTDGSAWLNKNDNNVTKVIRGGSWDINPRYCRSAFRSYGVRGDRYNDLGFRVACSPQGFS